VGELRHATQELTDTASSTRSMVQAAGPEIVSAVKRARTVADNLANATERLDRLVEENRQDVRAFTRDGLPELERFLREGRAAAQDIRELSRSLRENPSQLLYEPPQRGVEIPQ
jgi:phospholipid/cholesterol/gamma-HCH transport system substrate-binding protein